MESSQRTSPDSRRLRSQQMLKREIKDETLFLHGITHLMYNVVYDRYEIHCFEFRENAFWIGSR